MATCSFDFTKLACSSDSSQCVSTDEVCDGILHCLNVNDERTIAQAEYGSSNVRSCNNGACLLRKYICDGIRHCTDYSDEMNCGCRPNEYDCGDGRCISERLKCNGRQECYNGQDEFGCPPAYTYGDSAVLTGVMIGIIFGVAALLVLCVCCYKCFKNRAERNRQRAGGVVSPTGADSSAQQSDMALNVYHHYDNWAYSRDQPPPYEQALHSPVVNRRPILSPEGPPPSYEDYRKSVSDLAAPDIPALATEPPLPSNSGENMASPISGGVVLSASSLSVQVTNNNQPSISANNPPEPPSNHSSPSNQIENQETVLRMSPEISPSEPVSPESTVSDVSIASTHDSVTITAPIQMEPSSHDDQSTNTSPPEYVGISHDSVTPAGISSIGHVAQTDPDHDIEVRENEGVNNGNQDNM